MADRPCNICGTPLTALHQVFTKNNYTVDRCPGCGVGATQIDDPDQVLSIYDESYFQGGQEDGYADYVGSEAALRTEFAAALDHLRHYAPPAGRLLEVGCAYGFFLAEAAHHYDCTGLEVSQSAVEFCQSRGLKVYCDTVNSATIAAYGQFDVVVMLDVIEHLPDPTETLKLLASAMSPGASLILTTGDWDSLLARLMGANWRLMTPPQHLFFFTRSSITQLLEKSGLEIVRYEHPWKKVPLGLIIYQLRRAGLRLPQPESLSRVAFPVNLFDAMRVIARKRV